MRRIHERRGTVGSAGAPWRRPHGGPRGPVAEAAGGQAAPDTTAVLDDRATTLLRLLVHDVRGSLDDAVSTVSELRRRVDGAEGDDPALERLGDDLAKIQHVLGDVTEMGRLGVRPAVDAGERPPVDAWRLVQEVLQRVDTTGRHLRLQLRARELSGDPVVLGRIVDKLVANAVGHTPIDATVWVRTHLRGADVRLLVEDDGPGVPDGMKERIFQPWDRGDAPGERMGLGLGLTLARHLAATCGGELWVEDRSGGGARFVLRLPAPSRRGPMAASRRPPVDANA